ncbi:MAG: hypothetical protein GX107_05050 [Clostridiales bacterium]|nr:hypothetical protein [Clostridiales bacterium]
MRKLIPTTAAVTFFLITALLFSSCGGEDSRETTDLQPSEWSSAEVFRPADKDEGSQDVTENADKTQDNYINSLVGEALDAYSLFISTVPEIDREDSIEYEKGLLYYRVSDKSLNTIEKLRSYMLGYFSEEIVTRLLNVERYMAFDDGSLYVLDINMGTGATVLSESFTIKEQSKDKKSYLVTVVKDKDGDGKPDVEDTFDFVLEPSKSDSSKWVFTKFTYYR